MVVLKMLRAFLVIYGLAALTLLVVHELPRVLG